MIIICSFISRAGHDIARLDDQRPLSRRHDEPRGLAVFQERCYGMAVLPYVQKELLVARAMAVKVSSSTFPSRYSG